MKTAEEWNKTIVNSDEEVCELIRAIQKEAYEEGYNQALEDAVEAAEIEESLEYLRVDKDSILKLKK